MNVVFAPAQLFPAGNLVTVAVTGANACTVIVMIFDVAGLPDTHVSFDVTTQLIAPLVVPASVYVELFVPTFAAPFFHW